MEQKSARRVIDPPCGHESPLAAGQPNPATEAPLARRGVLGLLNILTWLTIMWSRSGPKGKKKLYCLSMNMLLHVDSNGRVQKHTGCKKKRSQVNKKGGVSKHGASK